MGSEDSLITREKKRGDILLKPSLDEDWLLMLTRLELDCSARGARWGQIGMERLSVPCRKKK